MGRATIVNKGTGLSVPPDNADRDRPLVRHEVPLSYLRAAISLQSMDLIDVYSSKLRRHLIISRIMAFGRKIVN